MACKVLNRKCGCSCMRRASRRETASCRSRLVARVRSAWKSSHTRQPSSARTSTIPIRMSEGKNLSRPDLKNDQKDDERYGKKVEYTIAHWLSMITDTKAATAPSSTAAFHTFFPRPSGNLCVHFERSGNASIHRAKCTAVA